MTPAQRRALMALRQHGTPKAAAEALGVSVWTIYDHLAALEKWSGIRPYEAWAERLLSTQGRKRVA